MRGGLLLTLFGLLHSLLRHLHEILEIHDFLLILRDADDLAEIVRVRGAASTNSKLLFVRTFYVQIVVGSFK